MPDSNASIADSIQDRFWPQLTCFGCGPANPRGLHIKSFEDADAGVRAKFTPWPEHDNGLGYLNGGIIATLLDCHSAAAVIVESNRLGLAPDGTLQYVTAGLDVRYLRPTPRDEQLEIVAHVTEPGEGQMTVAAELVWDGKPRAAATAVWKRWRPRTSATVPPTSH
ncbi:PaaI family thioesterase [Jatrophihabitans endophyticus]|uniref:PaaI family thioesterase n=1 Tax=Jatrophihabitans endophyticus TaxID=1206085 RepID=UPI0019E2F04D|nr:PaaI family thioesterase [Jatrophihabitans endophyticus]MBE7189403.1 PaaI family thioesterase [Jatrophihabitans endophyticus]